MWGENVIYQEPGILGPCIPILPGNKRKTAVLGPEKAWLERNHFKMSKGQVMDHDFSLVILLGSRKSKVQERPKKGKGGKSQVKRTDSSFYLKKKVEKSLSPWS